MQLFYLFNGWAGRNAWLDAAMRFFYVGAVPLLATALVAVLLFRLPTRAPAVSAPQQANHFTFPATSSSAWRVALATMFGALMCLLSMAAINAFALHWLGANILSPRPFVTHWVNALVVEPNDNSFPSPEMMLAACFATAIWSVFPRGGAWAWGVVAFLGFARLFCGTNYPIDVVAGVILGWAWSALALALFRVRLPIPSREGQILVWRGRHQAFFAASTVAALALIVGVDLARTPRYALKMQMLWSAPWNFSPVAAQSKSDALLSSASQTSKAGANPMHEGEGIATTPENDVAAPAPRFASDYGRQPKTEARISKSLSALKLAHPIVDVEVAQVRAGHTPYRAALVRFEARPGEVDGRQRVTQTAAALIKRVFHADASIQNVDVIAVVKQPDAPTATTGLVSVDADPPALGSTSHYSNWMPVFTASVQRRNLRIINGPQWTNAPGVDAGLWLRARSRLYIDSGILPPAPKVVKPLPTPAPTPQIDRKPAAPSLVPPQSTLKPNPSVADTQNDRKRTLKTNNTLPTPALTPQKQVTQKSFIPRKATPTRRAVVRRSSRSRARSAPRRRARSKVYRSTRRRYRTWRSRRRY